MKVISFKYKTNDITLRVTKDAFGQISQLSTFIGNLVSSSDGNYISYTVYNPLKMKEMELEFHFTVSNDKKDAVVERIKKYIEVFDYD